MEISLRKEFNSLRSEDRQVQHEAFMSILQATESPVDWAYEVWDELVAGLHHPNNRVRAISAQVLCNLAKSDPRKRMLEDLSKLLAVTKDDRFVTARHCMQSLWKAGVAGPEQQAMLLDGLEKRFRECIKEKNGTLIRYDILECLKNVYDRTGNGNVRENALAWIDLETDPKYKKKYTALWK